MEKITINNEVAKCIKSIGQDLINRADDISNDLKNVMSITIHSTICGGEVVNYDVTKNYNIEAFIDYHNIYKKGERK